MSNNLLELLRNNLDTDDEKALLSEARDVLLMQGAGMLSALKRCLRDKDLQIQLWTVELMQHVPMAYEQQALELLRKQLLLEERRMQRDNQLLMARIKEIIAQLEAKPTPVKPSPSPIMSIGSNDMLLDMFQEVQNMNIMGGYARFKVEYERKNDVRIRIRALGEDLVPAMKRILRHHDMKTQSWALEICDAIPDVYKPEIIELLKFQLKLEEKRTERDNLRLRNRIKRTLLELGDNSIAEEALAVLTTEEDYDARNQAIITLGRQVERYRDTFVALAKNDANERVRLRSIEQLGKLDNDVALLDLYQAFYEEDSVDIRTRTVSALLKSQVEDERIIEIAQRALDDKTKVMMQVIYALEKRNMPAMMPKLMAKLSEMTTAYVWQVAKAVRAQVLKFGNKPDDWQPLLDLLLNADDSKPAIQSSRFALGALQGMTDLSAMPVFMSYSKRDSLHEGDSESRPSFTVLHILKNMRKHIDWSVYEQALQPYLTSDDEDEQFMVARIAIFAGEQDRYPLLRQLRRNTTSDELIKFIDEHLTT